MSDKPRIDPITGEILEETPHAGAPNVVEYSVSEISGAIRRTVEDTFGHVRVRGEVGRVSRPGSGHVYLDLKDEKAVLAAVIWRGTARRLRFQPEEGLEVVATGRITTYAGQSKYQLVIEQLEPAGVGALMALLEERRRKLAAEGLFDAARKKPLPWLPKVIGVITSPTGAVIRDILHRLSDRFPRHVIVWPVRVQGETCAAEVARAIAGFNALPEGGPIPRPDLLIVARGGGSLEDLWGFNEEIVVRAAAASRIPLISAVGHETDTTLIDLAADWRAPTPTAAAEKAVPVRAELLAWVQELGARLTLAARNLVKHQRQRVVAAARALPRPEDILGLARQRLDHAASRLDHGLAALAARRRQQLAALAGRLSPHLLRQQLQLQRQRLAALHERQNMALNNRLAQAAQRLGQAAARLSPLPLRQQLAARRQRLETATARLRQARDHALLRRQQQLGQLARALESLSPKRVLERGYALVHDADSGMLLTRAAQVRGGQRLALEFADGRKRARAEDGGDDPPRQPRLL